MWNYNRINNLTNSRNFSILWMVMIIVSEIITIYVFPTAGILGYSLVITFILITISVTNGNSQNFLISILLIPLIRIISLVSPIQNLTGTWQLVVIYSPLLIASFIVAKITNIDIVGLIFRQNFSLLSLSLPIAAVIIGLIEYFILSPNIYIESPNPRQLITLLTIFITTTGLVEEIIFRGIIQHTSLNFIGKWGILYVNLIFGVLHLGFFNIADVIFVTIVGIYFSFVVKKTRSLGGVILAHGLANFLLFEVFPILFNNH